MAEPFVCINPDEVRDFEYQNGIFKLGVLTKDVYARCTDTRSRKTFDMSYLAVKHGVKGHENLEFTNGAEVPFETEEVKGVTVVSEKTMSVYQSAGLVVALGNELMVPGTNLRIEQMLRQVVAEQSGAKEED